MRQYKIFQVDAFTDQMFSGNPAGVVIDADGLSDDEMQKIARELNNSETVFILAPTGDDHDLWLRYFTPSVEVPLCGHATIAAHYVNAKLSTQAKAILKQKTGAGILPVEIRESDGDFEIVMTQAELDFSQELSENHARKIVAALGLDMADLDERCPLQIVGAGHSKVMIGIQSCDLLNTLKPDLSELASLSRKIECNGYFVFTLDSTVHEVLTHARMFAPAIGILEDPVTGNGNGPLGAYLVHNRVVPFTENQSLEFIGQQGEAMGRTGRVKVTVDVEGGRPVRTKVAGRAVVVFETQINLP